VPTPHTTVLLCPDDGKAGGDQRLDGSSSTNSGNEHSRSAVTRPPSTGPRTTGARRSRRSWVPRYPGSSLSGKVLQGSGWNCGPSDNRELSFDACGWPASNNNGQGSAARGLRPNFLAESWGTRGRIPRSPHCSVRVRWQGLYRTKCLRYNQRRGGRGGVRPTDRLVYQG